MRLRLFAACLSGALFIAAPAAPPAVAADLKIDAFYGTFSGGGVAESEDSVYFAVTARDLDVTVRPASNGGFSLSWTSVIRQGGDPTNPDVRRKSTTWNFARTGKAHVWRCTGAADPFAGEPMCWARIKEQTLSVYALSIRDDGGYELQQYDRTLSGTGMELTFLRHRDGERVRRVTGTLVKTAR